MPSPLVLALIFVGWIALSVLVAVWFSALKRRQR